MSKSPCYEAYHCKSKKSNLPYTRGITPKRVTSGGIHLRGLAPGQHSSKETSQWWRAVGDTVSDLTGQRIELEIPRTDLKHCAIFLTKFQPGYSQYCRTIWSSYRTRFVRRNRCRERTRAVTERELESNPRSIILITHLNQIQTNILVERKQNTFGQSTVVPRAVDEQQFLEIRELCDRIIRWIRSLQTLEAADSNPDMRSLNHPDIVRSIPDRQRDRPAVRLHLLNSNSSMSQIHARNRATTQVIMLCGADSD